MAQYKYSVTFEFDTQPPVTEKGVSMGGNIRTVAARALDDATRKNPNMKWSSVVIVIER